VSSLAACILTPFNFVSYGRLNPYTRDLVRDIAIDPWNILLLVLLALGIPIVLGMWTGARWPGFVDKAQKPMRLVTLLVLFGFVAIAFGNNMDVFLANADRIVGLVIGQNALALALG